MNGPVEENREERQETMDGAVEESQEENAVEETREENVRGNEACRLQRTP